MHKMDVLIRFVSMNKVSRNRLREVLEVEEQARQLLIEHVRLISPKPMSDILELTCLGIAAKFYDTEKSLRELLHPAFLKIASISMKFEETRVLDFSSDFFFKSIITMFHEHMSVLTKVCICMFTHYITFASYSSSYYNF